MPRKRHTTEQIIAILRSGEVEIGNGMTVEEFSRKKDITVQTYYRWRKEYGGVPADQLKRMKQLEEENRRLRKAVSDLTLDNQILQEVSKGKF